MSEAPAGIDSDINFQIAPRVDVQKLPSKDKLINPRIISQEHDAAGRNSLLNEAKSARESIDETKKTIKGLENKVEDRQENILVKLKNKLKIPDQKTIDLQVQLLEANKNLESLPKPKDMLDAYYEKAQETPLTNQEKRDLLKPEVLSQLTTDEYIDLWKRLNPYFMTHATPQGFDQQNSDALMGERFGKKLNNNFVDILKDGKDLKSSLVLRGLTGLDETSVTIFLSNLKVLQEPNYDKALERFKTEINKQPLFQPMPGYADGTSIHLAPQTVNEGYLGEYRNGVIVCFPTDTIVSQYDFGIAGDHKTLTELQGDGKMWDDIFIWSDVSTGKGINVDAGFVFIPEDTEVDPETGSKYASEKMIVDGKELRAPIENLELTEKYKSYVDNLFSSELMAPIFQNQELEISSEQLGAIRRKCYYELLHLGLEPGEKSMRVASKIVWSITHERDNELLYGSPKTMFYNEKWANKEFINSSRKETLAKIQGQLDDDFSRYKKPDITVTTKEYWENFFNSNPNLRPRHVVYYKNNSNIEDPTYAIYSFLRENKIGQADTSKTEGPQLGFEDKNVGNIYNSPRAFPDYQQLVDIADKIIKKHYEFNNTQR